MDKITFTTTVQHSAKYDVLPALTQDEKLLIVEAVLITADYQQDNETKQKVAEMVDKYNTLKYNKPR